MNSNGTIKKKKQKKKHLPQAKDFERCYAYKLIFSLLNAADSECSVYWLTMFFFFCFFISFLIIMLLVREREVTHFGKMKLVPFGD